MRGIWILAMIALLASFTVANVQVDVNVHLENNKQHHTQTIQRSQSSQQPIDSQRKFLPGVPTPSYLLPQTSSAEIDEATSDTKKPGFFSRIGHSIADYARLVGRWLKKYGRKWGAGEIIKRTRILKNNIVRIFQHNSNPNRHSTQALNQYSDMDDDEFRSTITNNMVLNQMAGLRFDANVDSAVDSANDETVDIFAGSPIMPLEDRVATAEANFDEVNPPPVPRPIDIDPLTGEGGVYLDNSDSQFTDAEAEDEGVDEEAASAVLGQWDWRRQGKVVPPRAQLRCGACWAFASSDAVASAAAIKYNRAPLLLSPQYLIDCNTQADPSFHNHVNNGCNGGAAQVAFHWLTTNNHILEQNYPYRGNNGEGCNVGSISHSYVKTSATDQNQLGFIQVNHDVNRMMTELRSGPAVVLVDGAAPAFRNYHNGIITQDCSVPGRPSSNHAVLLIGYGSENGIDYWVVKNSWTAEWGEAGYVRIRRGDNVCGIEDWFVRPLV